MTQMTLPQSLDGKRIPFPDSRQITLVGANGAGKSLFMEEMVRLCPNRAYVLSALEASFPERDESVLPGSIDVLYTEAIRQQPYLRDDAVSEIDKLSFLLFSDEFEYLLSVKAEGLRKGKRVTLSPTKLDLVRNLWERIFPGNHILRHTGRLLFATDSGENLIPARGLSQGEKAVLYYIGAVLFAMPDAVIFVDSPSLFLHPAILNTVWNGIEELRPDCTFVYDTTDVDFVNSRTENATIWVKSFDAEAHAWDYQVFRSGEFSDDLFIDLIGSRKPVLFIEGDAIHSIDAKLYTLVFSEFTVRPLGSCNKVIETTRSFNDLKPMHHLDSHGIVDRDRRSDEEVGYLRGKRIFVPDVAEVENIFLLEEVIRVMAHRRGKNADKVFAKVKHHVMQTFAARYDEQALQHVRHRVKHEVECKIDAKFKCISAMEMHLRQLVNMLRPREHYNELRRQFRAILQHDDYAAVLKVFNHKPMLPDSGVAQLLGFPSKEAYIADVLNALKGNDRHAHSLKAAIKFCFGLDMDNNQLPQGSEPPKAAEGLDPELFKPDPEEKILERRERQSRRHGKRYHRGKRL